MRQQFWVVLFLGLVIGAGCVDDEVSDEPNNFIAPPYENNGTTNNGANNGLKSGDLAWLPCGVESAVSLSGLVYLDPERLATSLYAQPMDGPGKPDVEVRLLAGNGALATGTTCEDGSFQIADLDPTSYYLFDAGIDGRVNSANDAKATFDAVAAQDLNLLVFGDSIPVYGPTPHFPNILSDHFEALGPNTLTNIAVSGTETIHWLPTSLNFTTKLSPKLADADLIVFSLGGNDLQNFGLSVANSANPAVEIGNINPEVDKIIANLKIIIAEIQTRAPHADLVWILYPNYAESTQWAGYLGEYAAIAKNVFKNLLARVRKEMAEIDGLIIVDMFSAIDGDSVSDLLIDPVHLNVKGHAFYAAEVFKAVGGIQPTMAGDALGYAVSP